MNFKILSVAIVVAASLAALASTPITAAPAYADSSHVHNNNIGNHATDSPTDLSCSGIDISDSCNTITNGDGGGGNQDPPCAPGQKPPGCKPT
jgi:hypothetical protein